MDNNLLIKLRRIYPDNYAEIRKAYEFAEKAHTGQKRKTGEDYIIHPCAVVEILADFGFDSSTVIAAFLHDVLEDTPVTADELKQEFGEEIYELVDGVTKLDQIKFINKEETQAENFRKIFVAMAKDLRVIIIKLADRLHNMRTLDSMTPEKQIEKSKETLDIYAPLAGRLGISFFKCELEDIAMKYLYPSEYKYISESVAKMNVERNKFLGKISQEIRERLDELGIRGEISGRQKHYYSIYKKMHNLHCDLDQIYDLFAVRIIVDNVKDCYTMLGEIHTIWKPIPGRFKDYIAMPKPNNYQSLHTTVVTQFNETFEIQIRTVEMHKIAEYGIAAHWKYKEGTKEDSALDTKVKWIREVMDAEKEEEGAKEFMDAVKINVFDDEVFVFTPKGDVYDLPVESTPIDLAYKIHSAVGNKCVGAKVNKKIVPLQTKLNNGDIVEILTSPSSRGPSLDWLKFVRTASARAKIRAFFKKEMKEENVARGQDMLERECRRRGYNLEELMKLPMFNRLLAKHSCAEADDLYAAIGYGGITTAQILTKLIEEVKKSIPAEVNVIPQDEKHRKRSTNGILINGQANFTVRMSQCCSPVPGDDIVGYISKGRGVSIHRKDCPNVKDFEYERIIDAVWDKSGNETYNATITIRSENRGGLLAQITAIVAKANVAIVGANVRVDEKQNFAETSITIQIRHTQELEDMIAKLRSLEGIIDITRKNS